MSERGDHTPPPAPWDKGGDEEAEPDWAQSIRDGRKARGDRLRAVFAGFEDTDDDPTSPVPARPVDPRQCDPEEDP
jgi:hypothetical protein